MKRNRFLMSQSPDGDFFDPESRARCRNTKGESESQSPDGDFFDPEHRPSPYCH